MQYEPTIEELRHKYEVAMKEKMLVRLEKDRLQARTEALEAQVMPLHWTLARPPLHPGPPPSPQPPPISAQNPYHMLAVSCVQCPPIRVQGPHSMCFTMMFLCCHGRTLHHNKLCMTATCPLCCIWLHIWQDGGKAPGLLILNVFPRDAHACKL